MDLDALYGVEQKDDGPGFVGIKFCQEWYAFHVMSLSDNKWKQPGPCF